MHAEGKAPLYRQEYNGEKEKKPNSKIYLPSTKPTCGIVPRMWDKVAPKMPVPNI